MGVVSKWIDLQHNWTPGDRVELKGTHVLDRWCALEVKPGFPGDSHEGLVVCLLCLVLLSLGSLFSDCEWFCDSVIAPRAGGSQVLHSNSQEQPAKGVDRRQVVTRSCESGSLKLKATKWVWWMVCLLCARFGEAAHPGPGESGVPTEFENGSSAGAAAAWTFGIFNPTGLHSKVDMVAPLPGNVWVVSETHLTQGGVQRFKVGLQALRSKYKHVVPGFPCEAKSDSDVGVRSGVLMLSEFPARPLSHDFSPELFKQSRCQVAGFLVGSQWVQVGMVYGFPTGNTYQQPRYQTDVLLEEVVSRLLDQTVGPWILCGDLNHDAHELDQLERLYQHGWREVQMVAAMEWNLPVQATGRGSRRLDHIWLSPELLPWVRNVSVAHDAWPDHAAVSVEFCQAFGQRTLQMWYRPKPFPWPQQWEAQVQFDHQATPTVAYAKMWQDLEQQAAPIARAHGNLVFRSQCGRGQVLDTSPKFPVIAPTKRSRRGDPQPSFHGLSLQHNRWFKQLRRLQCLART